MKTLIEDRKRFLARHLWAERAAAVIRSHGMTVRRVDGFGVLAAVPGTTREGWPVSGLSPWLATWGDVRAWLGY